MPSDIGLYCSVTQPQTSLSLSVCAPVKFNGFWIVSKLVGGIYIQMQSFVTSKVQRYPLSDGCILFSEVGSAIYLTFLRGYSYITKTIGHQKYY